MDRKVRVRFAPSPTGGLHLGGVRTALFNYLFAKKNKGTFILRVEDTDQNRFVEGAEAYINECLEWCGIVPDESPLQPGAYGPYRQSERKASYLAFAEQLVKDGHAYYAFDTPEALDAKRKEMPNFQYGQATRMEMRNSLTLSEEETAGLKETTPYVIRIKVPANEQVAFTDMIRGEVKFDTSLVDDKVLLKADGMPTYHLAVVVDDHAMEISHAFRGEEWLPSAPVHLLLWKYLGWEESMPQWAHTPLILKPDGNGKLSKRDGDRLGFPVNTLAWTDPKTNKTSPGFKELGFLPEAFINMLAMLGWNDGTDREIFTLQELTEVFSIERVSKAGAKFDFEKAKWFNHAWIQLLPENELVDLFQEALRDEGINPDRTKAASVVSLIKDRCQLVTDFVKQSAFFFVSPQGYDFSAVKGKWSEEKTNFFNQLANTTKEGLSAHQLEENFKELAEANGLKAGELMLPFRIMLVGGKFGPGIFEIAGILGGEEVNKRIMNALESMKD